MDYNRAIQGGRLTRDPETRHTQSGTAVIKFGLAVNSVYTSNGEKKQKVMFIDCTAFGRTGEVIAQYLEKGDPILIEGRLELQQWDAKDGSRRSKHELIVEQFKFVGSASDSGGGRQSADPNIPF